jgi:hypothetical protein
LIARGGSGPTILARSAGVTAAAEVGQLIAAQTARSAAFSRSKARLARAFGAQSEVLGESAAQEIPMTHSNDLSPASAPDPGRAKRLVFEMLGRGVRLWVEDGGLRFRASTPTLDPALREAIARRRDDLIAFISAEQAVQNLRQAEPLTIDASQSMLKPSLGQEMWWEWHRAEPTAASFTFPIEVPLHDRDQVSGMFRALLARHPTLCSRFDDSDGTLSVALNSADDFAWLDLGESLAEISPDNAIQEKIAQFSSSGIANGDRWLIRAAAWKAPAGYRLILHVSHMVFDVASISILTTEVMKLCRTFLDTGSWEESGVPSSPFFALAAAERDWAQSSLGEPVRRLWSSTVRGAPVISAPSGRPLDRWGSYVRASFDFALDPALALALERAASQLKTSLSVLLAACYVRAAIKWSAGTGLCMRVLRNKRDSVATDQMIGYWTATDIVACHTIPTRWDELVSQISWALDASYSANFPEQPGEWLDLQRRIPLTLNYMDVGPIAVGAESATDAWRVPSVSAPQLEPATGTDAPPAILLMRKSASGIEGRMRLSSELMNEGEQLALVRDVIGAFCDAAETFGMAATPGHPAELRCGEPIMD